MSKREWMAVGAIALCVSVVGGCVAGPGGDLVARAGMPAAGGPSGAGGRLEATTSGGLAAGTVGATLTLADPATATCAAQTLSAMTEPQRIGQLFLLGLPNDQLTSAVRASIAEYHVGSVWFTATTSVGVAGIRAVAASVQSLATSVATHGVRFFVAANQEGGYVQALRGMGFSTIPSALVQGSWSLATLQARAKAWGTQLRAAGVNLDFAPVADVVPPGGDATNAPIGQLQREYGHDPLTVKQHVSVFVKGMAQAGIATTAKHFPGLGYVTGNTDFVSSVTDTVTTPHGATMQPFAAAIGAGVPFVMVSLARYTRIDPAHLAVFSRTIITGLLRGYLHFGGVVMSDALTATAVATMSPAARAIDFVAAGGDMLVVRSPAVANAMATALAAQAARDAWFRGLVDAAVLRVLTAKTAYGLVPCG